MKLNLNKPKNFIKKRKKALTITAVVFVVVLILSLILRLQLAVLFNNIASDVAYSTYTPFTQKLWEVSYTNPAAKEYLSTQGNLIIIEEDNYTDEVPIEFGEEDIEDENLIEGMKYIIEGVEGKEVFDVKDLKIIKDDSVETKNLSREFIERIEPSTKKTVTGKKSKKEFEKIVNEEFAKVLEKTQKKESLSSLVVEPVAVDYKVEFAKNINIGKITYLESDNPKSSGFIKIANLQMIYQPCNYYTQVSFVFDLKTKTYKFENLNKFFKVLCQDSQSSPVLGEIATCDDCRTFPVDKTKRLLHTYVPSVQKISNVNTSSDGVFLHVDAVSDFLELLQGIKNAGHNYNVTSSYRSYKNQQQTFEYWVQREIRLFGYTRARAEQEANKYSAIPGFSEHQLGTTVDLNTQDCEAFDGYCQPNENMWAWLKANAWKYGFVLSYPEGREADTGYVSEKWHYRWLGRDLAKEFQAQNFKLTLNKWLVNKGLY